MLTVDDFGCTWDGERGLGVLLHGMRVVKTGGADTAFILWIAERDAERSNYPMQPTAFGGG